MEQPTLTTMQANLPSNGPPLSKWHLVNASGLTSLLQPDVNTQEATGDPPGTSQPRGPSQEPTVLTIHCSPSPATDFMTRSFSCTNNVFWGVCVRMRACVPYPGQFPFITATPSYGSRSPGLAPVLPPHHRRCALLNAHPTRPASLLRAFRALLLTAWKSCCLNRVQVCPLLRVLKLRPSDTTRPLMPLCTSLLCVLIPLCTLIHSSPGRAFTS